MTTWIDVVEAAYRFDGGREAWLNGLAETARPLIDGGFGICAALFDASDPSAFAFTGVAALGVPEAAIARMHAVHQNADAETIRRTYLSASSGPSSHFLTPEQYERHFAAHQAELGILDSFGLNAIDPTGVGCVLIAMRNAVMPARASDLTMWARVAAHVAAGHRLLRRAGTDAWTEAEAILEPSGKVQHAVGEAKDIARHEALKEMAKAIDKARGRRSTDAAVALWRALVDGRWSLVEHFDSDGRRYFVAHQNDPAARGQNALTTRERQVVAYASLGHPNKLIGYELGIAASTVANHLAEAARKLGVRSRTALIQLYGALVWGGA